MRAVGLAVVDSSGHRILGGAVGAVQHEFTSLFGSLTARFIVRGGPLFEGISTSEMVFELWNALRKQIARSALYIELWNHRTGLDEDSIIQEIGFRLEPHLNIVIPLPESVDELWAGFHSNVRNKIRRADTEGLVVRPLAGLEEMPAFYQILQRSFQRVRIPLPHISFFENVWKEMRQTGRAEFYVGLHGDRPVAARLVGFSIHSVYDWHAGDMRETVHFPLNEKIVYHIMTEAIGRGIRTFDFGGAGKPGIPYPPRDWKLKFGGELVDWGRYRLDLFPRLARVAKYIIRITRRRSS